MPLQAHDGIALDWSCRRQIVSGNRRKVRADALRLRAAGTRARAQDPPWKRKETRHPFKYFGAVPEIVVPDNLKSGQTYPPLEHRPASVFEARGSVHKAWISLLLKTQTPSPEPL